MLVKNVSHNVLDVFFDKGFENWGRVKVEKQKGNRILQQTMGKPLPGEILTYLRRRLGAQQI